MKTFTKCITRDILVAALMAGCCATPVVLAAAQDEVKIGLNIPITGPYRVQGIHQKRAAKLAVNEINSSGGILGRQVELVQRDSRSMANVTTKNVTEMIDQDGVEMVFGGSSSSVAIAAGKVAQEKNVPFFGTITYSTATTGTEARRHVFRECYNSWMGAKALASYLSKNFPSSENRYFYITADYTWGHTTEASIRKFSGTEDTDAHTSVLTPFPGAKYNDFWDVMEKAQEFQPGVLVLVLFGNDMSTALKLADSMKIKASAQVVVPNITLGMAVSAGPKAMEGVIGATPWTWQVPYKFNYPQGEAFVEKYAAKYGTYPSTSAASAYTILHEYKSAVERAGSFATPDVIRALEGHEYQLLKDKQRWRDFDHQSVQTVYAVKGKPEAEVLNDKFQLDYFEIISSISGEQAVRTKAEWNAVRTAAGKPLQLESLQRRRDGSRVSQNLPRP